MLLKQEKFYLFAVFSPSTLEHPWGLYKFPNSLLHVELSSPN